MLCPFGASECRIGFCSRRDVKYLGVWGLGYLGAAVMDYLVIMQWVGLGALTLTLLILMGTRWGQAKPLSKCIGLSVFAHILLITYAYGTKLILDQPGKPDSFIKLAVLTDEGQDGLESKKAQRQPWNDFPSDPSLTQPEDSLERQKQPSDSDATFWPDAEIDFVPGLDMAEVSAPEPDRPLPEVISATDLVSSAAPSEAEIDAVAAPRQEEVTSVIPPIMEASSPPRQSIENLAEPTPNQSTSPESPKDDLFDPSTQLQRLVDLPASERPVDAAQSNSDSPIAAENRRVESAPVERDGDPQSAVTNAVVERQIPTGSVESREMQPVRSVSDGHRAGDGTPLPELYSLRASVNRGRLLQRYGGTPQTEESVEAALKWLAANQELDGRWDADRFGAGRETKVLGHDRRGAGNEADSAITGFALLALLGSGHSHLEGTYRGNVQRGLEYLMQIQAGDGNLAGDARLFARMYCHGIAALALSEAMALTGDHRLKPYVGRAIGYTIEAQHPVTGGWRYQPGDRGDMSQFGWQVMALKSAQLAGVDVPSNTRGGMLRFLNEVSSGPRGGLASYRRGERVSPVMTAEALACRYFLGRQHEAHAIREAADFVARRPPGNGKANLYYWYYGTLALFQTQGQSWETWNRALQRQLLQRQRREGAMAGSWDPDTQWGSYGGRVYSTSMAALCLEVYYRYLPVYEVARR
jgi:hypothetical protein